MAHLAPAARKRRNRSSLSIIAAEAENVDRRLSHFIDHLEALRPAVSTAPTR